MAAALLLHLLHECYRTKFYLARLFLSCDLYVHGLKMRIRRAGEKDVTLSTFLLNLNRPLDKMQKSRRLGFQLTQTVFLLQSSDQSTQ